MRNVTPSLVRLAHFLAAMGYEHQRTESQDEEKKNDEGPVLIYLSGPSGNPHRLCRTRQLAGSPRAVPAGVVDVGRLRSRLCHH